MTAILFPGQGSQYSGMGKELFALYPDLCSQAQRILGFSVAEVCADPSSERLNQTIYTQPCIYFVSCLAYLENKGQRGDYASMFLGHSLGLYAALFAAGFFDLETGLEIVAKRGALMQAIRGGGMVATTGANIERINEILSDLDFFDIDIANFNSPSQIVLSGPAQRIKELIPKLKEHNYRCVELAVNGAFHSRYMEPARREFAEFIMDKNFLHPTATVISTVNGENVTLSHLLEELSFQLTRPVRWWQTIKALKTRDRSLSFTELGPGNVLTRLNMEILSHLEDRS